jgi:hypothetical protein
MTQGIARPAWIIPLFSHKKMFQNALIHLEPPVVFGTENEVVF